MRQSSDRVQATELFIRAKSGVSNYPGLTGKAGSTGGGRHRLPRPRANAWPGFGQELPCKGPLVTTSCAHPTVSLPTDWVWDAQGFSGKDWCSLCLLEGRVYSPRVVAQVWFDPWLPKKREGCGTVGDFRLAERPSSWHPHAMDAGWSGPWTMGNRVSTCAKEGGWCQNTCPSTPLPQLRQATLQEGRGKEEWLDLGLESATLQEQQGTC